MPESNSNVSTHEFKIDRVLGAVGLPERLLAG
jgi:hypothetical protein